MSEIMETLPQSSDEISDDEESSVFMQSGSTAFERKRIIDQTGPDYKPCLNCEKHPWYPEILPVTLHLNGKCLICGAPSYKPAESDNDERRENSKERDPLLLDA